MNVLLQRHCARYIYVVPEGLKELMTDISREVIRSHPENIYTFIADYLDALLITRENARVAARLVQSITEIATTTVELLVRTGMNRPKADKVVSIIQKTFRKRIHPVITDADISEATEEVEEINLVSDIINQADIPPEEGEEAAKIIQNAYRRFKARRDKERELLSGMVDWRAAARSAIYLYRKTGVTYEEANRAATLIKAAYKGYYTRRLMRKLADESRLLSDSFEEEEYEEEEEEEEEEDVDSDHDPKFVTIDYGSIIPHVDFAEPQSRDQIEPPKDVPEQEKSSTSVTVYSVIEGILDTTFEELQKREEVMSQKQDDSTPPPEPEVADDSKKAEADQAEAAQQPPGEGEAATEGETQVKTEDQPEAEGETKDKDLTVTATAETKEPSKGDEAGEAVAAEAPLESTEDAVNNA